MAFSLLSTDLTLATVIPFVFAISYELYFCFNVLLAAYGPEAFIMSPVGFGLIAFASFALFKAKTIPVYVVDRVWSEISRPPVTQR